jgi:ariadne-1
MTRSSTSISFDTQPDFQSPTAKILLCQHRWNVDRLIDKYMDSPTQTLHAAGEPANANMNIPTSPTPPPAKRARYAAQLPTFTCEICFDEPSPEGSTSLRCGHKFCNNCWDAYASTKIKDEGKPMIACMSEGCQTIMDEPTLQKVVDPKVYQR